VLVYEFKSANFAQKFDAIVCLDALYHYDLHQFIPQIPTLLKPKVELLFTRYSSVRIGQMPIF